MELCTVLNGSSVIYISIGTSKHATDISYAVNAVYIQTVYKSDICNNNTPVYSKLMAETGKANTVLHCPELGLRCLLCSFVFACGVCIPFNDTR